MAGSLIFSGRFSSLEVTGVRQTGRRLGKGSNATVEEVEWQGRFCAAKILHEILLGDESPGVSRKFVEGFEKECLTWSKLSHPQIAQFLGVCFSPRSAIPILLLEKMDISLRTFLGETQRQGFLLSDKIFILLQVSQGLAYLHSRKPALVHQDLSPNNILLNRVVLLAKLTDFGMSRVVDSSGGSHKSSVKGTQAFMSPEALVEPPYYDEKLDVFSFGNVIITTLTHAWPNPGASKSYKGDRLVALSEFERRKQYIIQLSSEESAVFVAMVRSCLEDRPNLRPTSLQLVGQMRQIEKDHPRKKMTEGPAMIKQHHVQLQAKDTQLRYKDTQIAKLLEEIQRLKQASPASSSSPAKTFKPEQNKVRQCACVHSLHLCCTGLVGTCRACMHMLCWRKLKVFRSDQVRPGGQHSFKMPDLLIPTSNATPVTAGRDVYLAGGSTGEVKTAQLVQVYNMYNSVDCRTLPPSPQCWSAAVAIDGTLVLIGGKSSSTDKPTNIMVSTWMAAEERWTQVLPSMKMKRHRTGVLLLNNHLFVFGGKGEDDLTRLDSFEVLDLNTKQWSEGRGGLPRPLHSLQLGVFEDYVMLYGGFTAPGTVTKACYIVPVQVLVDSVTNPLFPPIHWTPVQDAPYFLSALLTTSQDAVLIGGYSRDGQTTRAIHRFSSSGSWEVIGELSEPRLQPSAVAVSDRAFLVLGGDSDPRNDSNSSLLKSVELICY